MIQIKFQWLKDYKELEDEIYYLEWNLEQSQNELERWINGDLQKVRLTKGSIASRLEERIEEMEIELKAKTEMKQNLLNLINSFKGIDQVIVRGKYVEGKTLEMIAEEQNYSPGYMRTRHSMLKRFLTFLDETSDW